MQTLIEPAVLRTFVAIAETGSFTEAAKRVHRTQSAASMQIKRLEELLGRPVFTREGRTVRLSPDGELLLGHARRILNAHREALAALLQPELRGTVSLGTIDAPAVTFLPSILARFGESHPFVHVHVISDMTINLLRRLGENEIDFAIVNHGYGDDGGIILHSETLVWVTSAGHSAQQLKPIPLAVFHPGCKFRQWAIDALAKQARPYRIAYTSMSLAGIEAALHTGLAVSALPRSNVGVGLRILDERDGFPPLPNYQMALQRSENARSPIHDCLEQHIVSLCKYNTDVVNLTDDVK